MSSKQKNYDRAKTEGRLCLQCGGVITCKEWRKGFRLCWLCRDADKGVNVAHGHAPYEDEPKDPMEKEY